MNIGGVVYILSDQYILSLISSNIYEDQVVDSFSYTNIQDCFRDVMYVYACKYNKLVNSNRISTEEYEKLSLLESAEAMLITTTATLHSNITIYPDRLSTSDKDYLMWYVMNQRSFTLDGLIDIH
jgi:hypothetical protein